MEEKWQAPWRYEWEQEPPDAQPPDPQSPAPPAAAPAAAPPPTPWEPPVTPPPPPGRRARQVAMAAGGLTGLALLGGLLATCGPSGGHTGTLVTAPVSGSPGVEVTSILRPLAPRTGSASPSVPPSGPASSVPSGPASSVPSAAPAGGPAVAAAAPADDSGRQPEQSRTPRQHGRTGPASPPRHQSHGAPSRTAPAGPFPGLKVCDEAERLGEWKPGSEQAERCRSLYGN
ncbi:hypothetical protein [Kitasatospora sp. HPMI-4]|uniref:hypothetical protein n=1 Tax=Kitasatospora sp. HPMI-4 TaxID=3448443 RepID=UPI003F1DF97E